MPFRYSPEFRVLDLVAAGRSVASVADDLGVSAQTIYTWRKQELIDTGRQPGLTSHEAGERRVRSCVAGSQLATPEGSLLVSVEDRTLRGCRRMTGCRSRSSMI